MSVDQREFVDTNVLVYAHDGAAGNKHVRAKALLADLWANGNGCLSVQVLQEFYVNVTRKVSRPLNPEDARHLIEGLGTWMVHSPTSDDVVEAIRLHQAEQLSFWDAMILTSAARLGCSTVWSVDLGHGHVVGRVTIKNPFAA